MNQRLTLTSKELDLLWRVVLYFKENPMGDTMFAPAKRRYERILKRIEKLKRQDAKRHTHNAQDSEQYA